MNFINTAFSGMQAAQAHLNATAMNIANAKTPGYSRQRVEQSALGTQGTGLSAGNGVRVDEFKRITEQHLIREEWKETSNHNYFSSKQNYLSKLEYAIGDENTGIATGLQAFFNGLTLATSNPASPAYRENVINEANSLALSFNNFAASAKEQKNTIALQREGMVTQINDLIENIAQYNQKIVLMSANNSNVSALQDNRDEQVKKLSKLLDINVTEATDGSYAITIKGGLPLISGQSVSVLELNSTSPNPNIDLKFSGTSYAIDMSCGAGLGAINDYESGVLAETQATVEGMAEQLADKINNQLTAGYDLSGTAGKQLFNFDRTNPTGMLLVTDIKANELGFSSNVNAVGDASNLHSLIAIKGDGITLPGIGSTSLSDAGASLVGNVAFASSKNQQSITQTKNMLEIATFNRDSLSGIENDEEAANVMEYSKIYQANMKVISTGDRIFSELLSLFR
ncbi:flagellar hook-associated protein FlgK [Yersinia aleksiciae]|uniref:flagellar hook-associated protein FlgK n=1 Tax=Yersinia aleksiciae TaxID=263819 RepID=UPI0025AAAE88|nr:flagellar hook-associated protein FlgK [Yersinia aleksiciae]MDN0122253.1 flagellar hook-associated protein FlgK [Yersinia aleksiciae]